MMLKSVRGKCWITGGMPDGFTVKCEDKSSRAKVVAELLDNLPKFSCIKSGTPDSLVLSNDKIERSVSGSFERIFIGAMLESGITWDELSDDTKRASIAAFNMSI